ncbi:MAG: hypothetical protein JWL94_417 [Microbacteriaceae bacterium]|nr:hypothetical protein [Microbacteriaceae bacterium]
MAQQSPADRFDDVPDDLLRVGAHRTTPRKGRRWIAFAWAALATGVLVAAGVIGLWLFTDSIRVALPSPDVESTAPTAEPEPTVPPPAEPEQVEPQLDPDVTITVLNATTTAGLAGGVADDLIAEGWEGVGTRANADSADLESTFVYYSDPADEAAALALVQALGVGETRLSDDYPQSAIVVVIGSDYASAE